MKAECRMVVIRLGEGRRVAMCNEFRVSLWEEEKILEVDSNDDCTTA